MACETSFPSPPLRAAPLIRVAQARRRHHNILVLAGPAIAVSALPDFTLQDVRLVPVFSSLLSQSSIHHLQGALASCSGCACL